MPVAARAGPGFPTPPKLPALPILPMLPVLPPLVLLKETMSAAIFPASANGPEDRLPVEVLPVSTPAGDEYVAPTPFGSAPEACICPRICQETPDACALLPPTRITPPHCADAATAYL